LERRHWEERGLFEPTVCPSRDEWENTVKKLGGGREKYMNTTCWGREPTIPKEEKAFCE